MDYAGIDHLPVVFFFKNGVLKGRVLGFEAIMKETFSFKKKINNRLAMWLIFV
jgi:hypothetical protein